MRVCDLDEIKVCIDRQYENCHGYSGSKKAIYREAILAVKSILHSAKPIDGVTVQEWISSKDRLPDKTGRYLVLKNRIAPDCLGGNRSDIVILRFFVDEGFRMPIHIPDWINEEIDEEVTHWMPMPNPPKGE